jgi:aryl-alcohol dehydrogenase-like predicted oxidoreductase
MDYVYLGRSGLKVSRLAFGCMSYGDPAWRAWILDEHAAQPFFQRAVEAGINFFDTADMYSSGRSEEITGRAIKTFARRDEVVIATKVFNAMGDGPNMSGLSRKHILQACDASLERLGLETIDLYQIHRFDPDVAIDETLEALNDLVRAGKVRYIGASSGSAWRMAQALSTSEREGWARFVSMQNHYNLLYREEEREMIPQCLDKGIGIIPWSPLARGWLAGGRTRDGERKTNRAGTDPYADELYGRPADFDVIERLTEVAAERDVAPAQIALAWLLHQPGVTGPIIGATKLDHLEQALTAAELELSADEIRRLEEPYQPHPILGHN